MSDHTKLSFNSYQTVVPALEMNGSNYLYWKQDIQTLLKFKGVTKVMPTALPEDGVVPAAIRVNLAQAGLINERSDRANESSGGYPVTYAPRRRPEEII
jgi:hypothetical protein